jgi:ribosomal protein S18 acetylase RimI-like enzyme
MSAAGLIEPTPWDSRALGAESFEVKRATPEAMALVARTPGHYTVKVDPLASKRLLHESGFYYCDTLLEPHCARADLIEHPRAGVTISSDVALERLRPLCHGAFSHDRFHRDFNVAPAAADERYDNWLAQMHAGGQVYGISLDGELAAFIALVGTRMALHATAREQQGRGQAKYLWSAACRHFFDECGVERLESSISAANLAALNLYASLGFRFGRAVDVYHRVVDRAEVECS